MKKTLFIACCLQLLGSWLVQAQRSSPQQPRSFTNPSFTAQQRIAHSNFTLPALDNAVERANANKLLAECRSCKKDFYGKPIDINIDLTKTVRPFDIKEGKLWVYQIESATAKGLQFYFETFKLPSGATLHIYNEDHSIVLGSFTDANHNPDLKFTTQIIPSGKVILEYFEPTNAAFNGSLVINKAIHVFKSFNSNTERSSTGFGESGSCTVNVNCSAGSPLTDVKKAVGFMTYFDMASGLTAVCTGFLINSTGSDAFKKPMFMSAGHCVKNKIPGTYYSDFIIYFNYENEGCTNDTTDPLINADSFQGAYLRTVADEDHLTKTDYALLELLDKPQQYASVAYLGWDRRTTLATGGTYNISHPSGDAKKIAIDHESPVAISQISHSCISAYDFEGYQVDWNVGVTQPGSSGSPLLNGFKRVIGVLSGGNSRCSDSEGTDLCGATAAQSGPDWFSKMSYLWNHPNPGHPEIFSYLDPANTNAEYIDGYFPSSPDGYVKIYNITLTSDHWEDGPMLVPQISTSNAGTLTYSWSPADDIYNPNEAVAILFFGGTQPLLPLTKTYTLTVSSTAGYIATKQVSVTLYDCANKSIDVDVCAIRPTVIGKATAAGETYSWSPATYLSATDVATPTLTPVAPGLLTYTLTATSAECTRTVVYNIASLNPPEPPSFTPHKVVDARYGTWDRNDNMIGLRQMNGQLAFIGFGDHRFDNGDHVGEIRKGNLNTEEYNIFYLDNNLSKISNFSIDNLGYSSALSFDNTETHIYFMMDAGIRKTDMNIDQVWFHYYPPTSARPIKIRMTGNGYWLAYNNMPSSTFTNSGLDKYDYDGNLIKPANFSKQILNMAQTDDGGVIALFKASNTQIQVAKFNASTVLDWSMFYDLPDGVFANDFGLSILNPAVPNTILQTSDNGYVFGASKSIPNNNPYPNPAHYDFFLFKVNSVGGKMWEKTIGGPGDDQLTVIKETSDHGLILGGSSTSSAGGDKSENSRGLTDFWIVKLDAFGTIQGDKTIGGNKADNLVDIIQTDFQTYLLAGTSASDISGEKSQSSYNSKDFWVVKIVDDSSPTPDEDLTLTEICESFASDFNNTMDPFIDQKIVIGGCQTPIVVDIGAILRARASHQILIKPGVEIRPGSDVKLGISSLAHHPCEWEEDPAGRIRTNDKISAPETNFPENKIAGQEFIVTPNPTSGSCLVSIPEDSDYPVRFSLMNAVGKVLKDEVIYTPARFYELALYDQAAGVFLIRIETTEGTTIKKVIKR